MFLIRVVVARLWAVLTGLAIRSKSGKNACAYCRGAGCVPDSGLFSEACPLCGGTGTSSQEVAR